MRRLVAAWITLALCAPAAADEVGGGSLVRVYEPGQALDLRADSLEYEAGRKLYVASGNVVIRQQGRELKADWVAYSRLTRRGVASGNVTYSDGGDTLTTSFVEFDIDTLEGVMFDAEFVNKETLELRGEEIQKTGRRTYRFRNGSFTSCSCPDPEAREPWEIEAEEADLEIEGYGTARNARFKVLGVPVGWLPWVILPLKTKRQSGILLPEFRLSQRSGFEVGVPLFWAAADPVNVTLTPRWLSKRGFKPDLDVEYVVGEESGGELFGAYIHDQKVNSDTRKTPFGKNRWTTYGEHDFHLPAGWRIKTDYVFDSDNAYPNDFADISRYDEDRFLISTASATKPFGEAGAFGLVGAARFADDRQNPDDTDRDDFLLQRLPDLGMRALPASLPFAEWLAPALDVEYVYFYHMEKPGGGPTAAHPDSGQLVTSNGRFLDTGRDGLPDSREQGRTVADSALADPNMDDFATFGGTEGDGVFQEGELLADDGQRVVLTPRLGAPLRLFDALELYPEAGWYETLYGSNAQGFERRGLFTARADLRTRLRGRFGQLSHLLEPRLGYAFVMDTSQRENPLYVPATAVPQQRLRELDLDNVTRDRADRIAGFNGLTFALGNRLYERGGEGARLLGDFVLSAGYDFESSEFADLYLDGRLYPMSGATLRFNLGFDPRDAEISEGLLRAAYSDERGDEFWLGYRYIRDIPDFFELFPQENQRFESVKSDFNHVNQISAGFRIAITRQWAVLYRGAYSFERSVLLANAGGVEYISGCRCWAARIEVRQRRNRGVGIDFRFTFVGIADDSRSPFESPGRVSDLGFTGGASD